MTTQIFTLGSNGNYQLGLGHDEDISTSTGGCLKSIPIKQIASGGNHTVAVSKDGKLYGTGLTKNGQLTGEKDHVIEWDPIYTGFRVKMAAAGWEFTVLVSADDDSIWTTGFGFKGELGIAEDVTQSSEFQKIPDFHIPEGTHIKDVKAGMAHVVVLLDDGSVYGWGAGRKGQLGEPQDRKIVKPRLIKSRPTISHIACGREYTVVGSCTTGEIELFGSVASIDMPKTIPGFVDLQSGWSTVHVLSDDGTVASWGNNSNGQCAPAEALSAYKIRSISAGTEHVLAITDAGELIAWGWGEHGNCGGGGNYKDGQVSVLEPKGIAAAWGGYATSFYSVCG